MHLFMPSYEKNKHLKANSNFLTHRFLLIKAVSTVLAGFQSSAGLSLQWLLLQIFLLSSLLGFLEMKGSKADIKGGSAQVFFFFLIES